MAKLTQLWLASLLFRRIAAVCVFVVAALLVYFGSHIPRTISLPVDDLNTRAEVRVGEEQLVIENPVIAPGEIAVSYTGSKNEVAGIWAENATIEGPIQHLLFPNSGDPKPALIGYTTNSAASPATSGETCRTAIEIRLAKDSIPIKELKLFQTDETAGAQRFRQVVVDAGASTMEINAHTDAPSDGATNLPGCKKLLTVGDSPSIDLPLIPVQMFVHGGKIELHFNPANPAVEIWTGPDGTFEAVSVGEATLRAGGLRIESTQRSVVPRLDVRTPHANDQITLGALKIGSDKLRIAVGHDTEKALVCANGASLYNYDLIDAIQKNPILSFAFAAVLVPALWNWIRKNCFPSAK